MKIIPRLKILTASKKQQEYIEILANDCGFNLAGRKAYIKTLTGHEIPFLDELTSDQASKVITALKELKESQRDQVPRKSD